MPFVSRRLPRGLLLLTTLTLWVSACAPSSDTTPVVRQVATRPAALDARCTVNLQGSGELDIEDDYLPHVVACENGAADFEALRAQAVAARSYLYYKLDVGGTLTDGQGDQVYTCNNAPTQEHYDAVATTAGEILRYRDTTIAAFYVAGAVPSTDDCVPLAGDNDYSSTEHFVTYNQGAAGAGLEQTSLGWVNAGNYANRGCHSQNGASCLSEHGWPYEDILRFYYGMDIEHEATEGDCVVPTGLPHGCGLVVSGAETVYDDSGACFLRGCASGPAWGERAEGVSGGSLVTGGFVSDERDCFGRWQLSFAEAGDYVVDVHIPDVGARVSEARYGVRHGGQHTDVTVAQSAVNGWVSLGTYAFAAGSFQYVELGDDAPEAGTVADGPYVVFDAVRVRPAGTDPVADAGVPSADAGGEAPAEDAGSDVDPADAGAGEGDDDAGEPGGVSDDGGPRFADLPPSVVAQCACVAAAGGPLASGPFGLLGLLAGAALVVRRRPSRGR